jgi:hypothetical protein
MILCTGQLLDATNLTFGQQIATTVIGAIATAVIVTVGGGLVVGLTTRSWQNRRELFDLRTSELERATRTAQRMYVACQHARRLLRDVKGSGPGDEGRRAAVRAELSEVYLGEFSPEAALIETVLGARFGVRWAPDGAGFTGKPLGDGDSDVYWRWHQIRDLLTVYYFNVQGQLGDDLLQQNSLGFEGKYHSGLELAKLVKDRRKPSAAEVSEMRQAIRSTYEEAISQLARAMLKDKIRTG